MLYDQITYKGYAGTQRVVKVWYTDLGQALRTGYTLQTYNCLFPGLNSTWVCGGSTGNNTIYTANVASKVELPNGDVYRLYYNPYRELARVEIPTGGAVEYDYSPQSPNYSEAISDAVPTTPDDEPPNTIILYRGTNGTNPGQFRVDADGVSAFEVPPPGYSIILPIRATYVGPKLPGTVATLIDPLLGGGTATYTPQIAPFHWSLNFPGKSVEEIKKVLSQFAKESVK